MSEGTPFIQLRLCLAEPPELFQLISALTALGHQFEDYLRRERPELQGYARLVVKEIRQGSILIDLVPQFAALIAVMDTALIVDSFVTQYGGAIRALVSGDQLQNVSKSDLEDFKDAVTLIANVSSAVYHQKGKEKRVEFEFTTKEAREAKKLIERRTIELNTPVFETKNNVLMVFWQSNLEEPPAGKRTRERALIEEVHRKPLAISYGTDEVRERIKYETRDDDRNIYKKGFFGL